MEDNNNPAVIIFRDDVQAFNNIGLPNHPRTEQVLRMFCEHFEFA